MLYFVHEDADILQAPVYQRWPSQVVVYNLHVCPYSLPSVLYLAVFLVFVACSRRLDCGEQRKATRGAKVGTREDWERGEELSLPSLAFFSCSRFFFRAPQT